MKAELKAELKADIGDVKTRVAGLETLIERKEVTMQRWLLSILVTIMVSMGLALVRLFMTTSMPATPPAPSPPAAVVAESSAPRTPAPSDQDGT